MTHQDYRYKQAFPKIPVFVPRLMEDAKVFGSHWKNKR